MPVVVGRRGVADQWGPWTAAAWLYATGQVIDDLVAAGALDAAERLRLAQSAAMGLWGRRYGPDLFGKLEALRPSPGRDAEIIPFPGPKGMPDA